MQYIIFSSYKKKKKKNDTTTKSFPERKTFSFLPEIEIIATMPCNNYRKNE